MGILLGLATALGWGCSDFLARFSTRRIGTLRTTLYMQGIGFLLLTGLLAATGRWGHLADGSGWQPWAWGALAGAINCFATLTLYRSFEVGRMSVVAPISASYPALTLLLAVATGERLTAARAIGIGLTLLGAILVASGEESSSGGAENLKSAARPGKRKGVLFAVLAASGFGLLFWLLGTRIITSVGPWATVWMIRLTSMLVLTVALQGTRQKMGLPGGAVRWQLLGMGVLDTSAFVLNNRGMEIEQVSVVSVLSSLYGAVTVALAAIILKERPARKQWAGIFFIFCGIFLIVR